MVKIIECPRDAMQGWPHLIATEDKVPYLQQLLQVGFDTIDFGSFVSPKAIPQMADTKAVLDQLDLSNSKSKLLAIVANERGAEAAAAEEKITYLGFPFSLSETFQQRNTNASMAEALERIKNIQQLCQATKKVLVVYLSMGFGNPYGDAYNEKVAVKWALEFAAIGISILSLADTVGIAEAGQVQQTTAAIIKALPNIEIGVHLHCSTNNWEEKLQAALDAGCTRIDGALKGIGGCPMAGDDLVGNMNTSLILPYLSQQSLLQSTINEEALLKANLLADRIFI